MLYETRKQNKMLCKAIKVVFFSKRTISTVIVLCSSYESDNKKRFSSNYTASN